MTPFESEMGNKYIRERPLEEIVDKLMLPPPEEEEEEGEPPAPVEESALSIKPDPKAEAAKEKEKGLQKDKKGSVA